jgi:hypothetical protein
MRHQDEFLDTQRTEKSGGRGLWGHLGRQARCVGIFPFLLGLRDGVRAALQGDDH